MAPSLKQQPTKPLTIVSTDCHVGPSLRTQLREYCESRYLDDFD